MPDRTTGTLWLPECGISRRRPRRPSASSSSQSGHCTKTGAQYISARYQQQTEFAPQAQECSMETGLLVRLAVARRSRPFSGPARSRSARIARVVDALRSGSATRLSVQPLWAVWAPGLLPDGSRSELVLRKPLEDGGWLELRLFLATFHSSASSRSHSVNTTPSSSPRVRTEKSGGGTFFFHNQHHEPA